MNHTTLEKAEKDIEFVKAATMRFLGDIDIHTFPMDDELKHGNLFAMRYGDNDVVVFKTDENYTPVLYKDAVKKPYVTQSEIVRAAESIILEAAKQLGSNTSDEFKEVVREFRELVG